MIAVKSKNIYQIEKKLQFKASNGCLEGSSVCRKLVAKHNQRPFNENTKTCIEHKNYVP